jgi:subtilase-type serine protease
MKFNVMENNKKSCVRIFKKNAILLSLLQAVTLPIYAADVHWTNSTGDNQFFNDSNWSTNLTPDLNDDIRIDNSNGTTVELTFDENSMTTSYLPGSGGTIYVGSGAGNSSGLKIGALNPTWSLPVYLDGSINVASQGAKGVLEHHYDPDSYSPKLSFQDFDIASGLNSDGQVSLTGTGKSTAEQMMGNSAVTVTSLQLASDGGKGVLTIDGSSLEVSSFTAPSVRGFSLGDGTNSGVASDGTINVLGGGKMIVSASPSGSPANSDPSAVIGHDGGKGTLNISGAIVKNGENLQSRVNFAGGLALGENADSVGRINVTDGALLATMTVYGSATDTSAYLGLNGGQGSVVVSGSGSVWQVSGQTSQVGQLPMNEVGHLSVGESGEGNVTLANGGKLSTGKTGYESSSSYPGGYEVTFDNSVLGNLYLANQINGKGTLNIGAAENEAAQGTGVIEVEQIVFGAGDGTLLFNHTDQTGSYTFDTTLTSSANGQGTIKHINGVTVFDTAQTAFTGKSDIKGGTMVVNSTLGGTVEVSTNGTLAGSGNVGATLVINGGTISPGQYGSTTPTTLTINGDLTMQAGSVYSVNIGTDISQLNPYVSDLLMVNGDANLNGASVKAYASGDFTLYVPDSRWHILSASGSVNGQFGQLTVMPFVNLDYEYDPQNVYLVVTRNNTGFCTSDMTYNQCSTGSNIESQGSGLIYDVIASQTSFDNAKYAFDQLSGEIHATAKGVMLEDSRFIREAVNQHLLNVGDNDGAWVHTFGSWGNFDSDGNAADIKRNIGGVFVGVDSRLNDSWVMGITGGFSKASIKNSDRRSNIDREDYHLGLYTQGAWENLSLRAGAGYSWHSLSSDRYIDIPGLQDHLKADYDASTMQIFTEGSYQYALNSTMNLEPYVNLAYVKVDTDSFNETGGIAKLSSVSDDLDMVFSTVGARFTGQFTLNNGMNVKHWGMAGWRHSFNDVTPHSDMNFTGYSSFDIKGTPISRNVAILEAGSEIQIEPDVSIGLMYNGQMGDSSSDHGAKVYLNWRF